MSTMTKIMRQHGPEYRAKFGLKMPENHHKVMTAISNTLLHDHFYGSKRGADDHPFQSEAVL